MTRCTICNSPSLAAIDDLLDAGTNQKEVAAQFGVSRFALSRHVRHSKATVTPEPETDESLEVQAARWLARADDIYSASTVNGDVRGQVQALTAAFRGLELQHRAESRSDESKPKASDGAPVTIEMIDDAIAKYEAAISATPRSQWLHDVQLAPDRILVIAAQMCHDSELFRDVEQYCTARRVRLVN